MATTSRSHFDEVTQQRMRDYYRTLSEKDRRRFAALEALRIGRGGQVSIAELLGCSTRTIARGIAELNQLADGDPCEGRVRRPGAGRPQKSPRTTASTATCTT